MGTYEEALKDLNPSAHPPGWYSPTLPLKYMHRVTPGVEAGMNINMSEPTVWVFQNDAVKNEMGISAGYAIVPGSFCSMVFNGVEFCSV